MAARDEKLGRDPEELSREERMILRRRTLMLERGIRPIDLKRRWEKMFGSCSKSMVTDILNGRARSVAKEQDLAKLVGVPWRELWDPPVFVRRRDLLPTPEEIAAEEAGE